MSFISFMIPFTIPVPSQDGAGLATTALVHCRCWLDDFESDCSDPPTVQFGYYDYKTELQLQSGNIATKLGKISPLPHFLKSLAFFRVYLELVKVLILFWQKF